MTAGSRTRLRVVLFVDQVGSTELLTRLGDIEADALRRTLEPILDDAIRAHEGEIVKTTGDGRMAVFESASQAIDAGVAMHRQAARINRAGRAPAEIRLRVGVSVGDVTEEAGDYHGSAVVEAARLESAASRSGMLCTDLARALAGNRSIAEFTERVEVEAKGFPEPIVSWVVTWPDETFTPIGELPKELGAGARFEFVGRSDELDAARTAWKSVIDGVLTGVLISGEPGVGKSRLARELGLTAMADGATIVYGRCDEGVGASFQPIAQALAYVVEQSSPGLADLGRFPGELARLLPELTAAVPGLPPAVDADPDTEQYRLFDAVLSWLETMSTNAPVLLVVDDIQWAAPATLQMLRHLVRRPSDVALCVLCTYRSTEADAEQALGQFLADLNRHGRSTTIQLEGLDEASIGALLETSGIAASLDDASAAALTRRLAQVTAGNPFFLSEILAQMREQGLDAPLTVLDRVIPAALGDFVLDRVARLSPSAVELLGFAAVAGGGGVGIDVLAVASGRPRAEVIDATDEALRAGLLIEVSDAPIRFRFQHDLVRTSLYDQLSSGRRSQRHHEIALAIDEVHARDLAEHVQDLAYHYARSADPASIDRAVVTSQMAGDQATARLSFSTGVANYEQALELMDRYGCRLTEQVRGRLKLSLGVAMKRAGQRGSRTLLFEAAEIAAACGDSPTVVQAALANTRGFFSSAGRTDQDRVRLLELALEHVEPGNTAHTAKLLANLSVELTFDEQDDRRRALSDASLAMAEQLDDPTCLAHVINQRIGFFWTANGLHERVALGERLQRIADQLGSPQWQYTSASSRFQSAMECGDLDLADRCIEQMRTAADELRQPVVLSYLRMRESVRAIVGGELDVGERLATECFELGQAAGQPDALTFYFGQLINLRFHQGRMDELSAIVAQEVENNPGIPSLQAALAILYCETDHLDDARAPFTELTDRLDDLHRDLSWLVLTVLLADACFQLGDTDRAPKLHAALEPFRQQCADNATNWFGGVGHHLALLEHTMGRYDDADASFDAAVRWHERMPAPAMLARIRIDWATSLVRRPTPDRSRASELIAAAEATAERIGLGNVTRRAAALAELA